VALESGNKDLSLGWAHVYHAQRDKIKFSSLVVAVELFLASSSFSIRNAIKIRKIA
jgi:hypothetical protein